MLATIIILCSFTGLAADRWVSRTGSDVPGGGTEAAPWRTIHYAITNSLAGDVIHIMAGRYAESSIVVDKSLTIQGDPLNRGLACVVPVAEDGNVDNAFDDNAQNGFVIKANNVTIEYLTINGRGNPSLTPGKDNFRAGIVTLDASQAGGGVWNNLHVNNVVIRHAWRRGISVYPNSVSGTLVENTRVDSVAYNQAIYLAGQGQALNDTINHCFQGIVFNPDGTTPAGLIKASGNVLNHIENFPGCWGDLGGGIYYGQPRGLEFNNTNSPLRNVEFSQNKLNTFGTEAVGIYTVRAGAGSVVSGNIISFNSYDSQGMVLGWSYNDGGFLVTGNTIQVGYTGTGIAIFNSGSITTPMLLHGNTITGVNSLFVNPGSGTGVVVSNRYLGGSDSGPSYVLIENGNSISGFVRGIDVLNLLPSSPPPLSVTIENNDIFGNSMFGVVNNTGSWVDAGENWWGSCTGPYNGSLNPSGLGNPVSGFVTINPWVSALAAPGAINGPDVAYQGQNGIAYSIPAIAHATGYAWTLPAGARIASGEGTNSILVDFSLSAVSGDISVYAFHPTCNNTATVAKNIQVSAPLPENLSMNNITVHNGETSCYNALQNITVGGVAGPYTIEAGGSITMIAGNSILYLPGTTIHLNGYLHGMITTNGTYCGQQHNAPGNSRLIDPVAEPGADFFKVFPNPTQGKFNIEFIAGEESAGAVVRIYSLMGGLVLEKTLTGFSKNEFSLENSPGGIYIIRVMKSDKVGTAKIIRQN